MTFRDERNEIQHIRVAIVVIVAPPAKIFTGAPVQRVSASNQIRPIAIGRNNWLFAGSLRAGKRAAAVMSLVQSARLNGHDPYAYLKDVLERLPTQQASRIGELLPHRWQAPIATAWPW